MKRILFLPLLFAGTAAADYSEERQLVMDAKGVSTLRIDAGAGALDITGADGVNSILVEATIRLNGVSGDKAKQRVQKHLELSLELDGDQARLVSNFDSGWLSWDSNGHVDLEVQVPTSMNLDIDDGSGSISLQDVAGAVAIDDGSGPIVVRNVGPIEIDDGSGSIDIETVTGDATIDDGSGSLRVVLVAGSVVIDDGSGPIDVDQVGGDLRIVNAGSGSVDVQNIAGEFVLDD